MIKLIVPRFGYNLIPEDTKENVYFLAGPIRGGTDWQADAIDLISELDPSAYIVNPCRYDETHRHADKFIDGARRDMKDPQTPWERHYIKIALRKGCLLFWLGLEDKNNPRNPDQGPYGMDSGGEVGRWGMYTSMKYKLDRSEPVRMVLGGDPKYHGIRTMRKNLSGDYELDHYYPTIDTLGQTVQTAVEIANGKRLFE